MPITPKSLTRRVSVAAAASALLASLSLVAPTASYADSAGPKCQNGADQADFYNTEGWNRTFNPGGLCLTALNAWRSVFQTDGNLVTYSDTGHAVWSTGTNGKGATRLVLQTDGNMVIYNGGKALWSSRTSGRVGYYGNYLKQTDGPSLNIYSVDSRGNSTKIW